MIDPVCAAKDFTFLQDSWLLVVLLLLLLREELSDALAREESDPWSAPQKDIAGVGGADALDGLSGKNLDGGEDMVGGRGGVNVEVSVLTREEVESAGVGGLGEGGIEG